jgi:hypothetical protein
MTNEQDLRKVETWVDYARQTAKYAKSAKAVQVFSLRPFMSPGWSIPFGHFENIAELEKAIDQ